MNHIDKDAMGADFCWSFGNGDARACMLPRQDVRQVFSDCGFDPSLIETMDASEAIIRAARLMSTRKRIIVKQMERPNRDTPRAFGVYWLTPRDGESGDDIVCGARVRVDSGESAVCMPPTDRDEIPLCMQVGDEMVRIVDELIRNVFNRDVSQALLAVGTKLGWLNRRRNKGGVYYLNRHSAERFSALLMRLKRMTNTRDPDEQFIPHITEQYAKPMTIESWSGAARDHYTSKTKRLVSELDRMFKDGKMRDATITARANECDALLVEAQQYKSFMRGELIPLEIRLKKIQGAFAKALAEGNEAVADDIREVERMMTTANMS